MGKIINRWVLVAAMFFVGVAYTGAYFSDSVSVSGNTFTAGVSSHSDIALNEFMANPPGAENAPMPDGEWVELYNKGPWPIDVNGWYLYDAHDDHDLPITTANVGGGSTIIPAHGYLVVYRNGDPSFSLNNDTDTLRLYDGTIGSGSMIDSYTYTGTTEDETWARVPNGTGSWTADQTPTKGGSNG